MLRKAGRLGPRSEEWRLHWCLRTCVSIAVCCFIYFFVPTRTVLNRYTDPPFAVFVAALVKDATLGSTIMNIWACILGSLIASVVVQIIYSCLAANFESPDQYPISLLLVILFVTVFTMQYMELPLMGKRLGVSLLALNIVSWPEFPTIPINIWRLYLSVVVGCACGIIGAVFPLPMRLAGVEVNKRLHYCCNTICDLLREEVSAWIHQPSMAETLRSVWSAQRLTETPPSTHTPWRTRFGWSPSSATGMPILSRWRRVRVFFRAYHAIRHAHRYGTSWIVGRAVFKLNDRPARAEMLVYLQSQLDLLAQRNREARFEQPSRSKALQVFSRYIGLLRSVVFVQRQLEIQVLAVDKAPQGFQVFFADPDFRRALYQMVEAIVQTLQALFDLICQRCAVLTHVAQRMVQLRQAHDEMDRVYFQIRSRLSYSTPGREEGGCARQEGVHDVVAPSSPSSASRPLPDVCFGLNTVLFLLDSLSDSLLHFHSPDELSWMQLNSCCVHRGHRSVYRNTWTHTRDSWQQLVADLLPAQTPAYFFRYDRVHGRVHFLWTPHLRYRVGHASVVAVAMTLAAVYGICNERQQPALASFTVAYLAGFPAPGMNLITALNRTAGTVVASVFVIFVVLTVGMLPDEAYAARAVILAVAAVAFQLPATYVRSFPIPSYGGTVAAFTAALLLFADDPTVEQSIRRVLDTSVGVGIFLVLELAWHAQSAETLLVQDVCAVLHGVRRHFLDDVVDMDKDRGEEGGQDLLRRWTARTDGLDALHGLVARQRAVRPFARLEPRLLAAPSLSDRLWQEVVGAETRAVAALGWVCAVVDKVRIRSVLRRERWTTGGEGADRLPAPEALAGRLRGQDLVYYYRHLAAARTGAAGLPEADRFPPWAADETRRDMRTTSDIEMAATGSREGAGGASAWLHAHPPLPDFEAFLRPLGKHFECVGEVVDAAVDAMIAALTRLKDTGMGSVHTSEYAEMLRNPETHATHAVRLLSDLTRGRCASQLQEAKVFSAAESVESRDLRARRARYYASFFAETGGGEEVRSLCVRFEHIARELHQAAGTSPAGQLASNEEVKVVCTLLQSTQDLLAALQQIARGIARMQAARDIAVTQSGT